MLSATCRSRVVLERAAILVTGLPRNGNPCRSHLSRQLCKESLGVHCYGVSRARNLSTESRTLLDLAREDEDSFGTLSSPKSKPPRRRSQAAVTNQSRSFEQVQRIPEVQVAEKSREKPALSPADNFTPTALAELDGDEDESVFESPPAAHPETRKPISYYVVQIRSFLKKKMLKEAIDVLEVKMLKRDGRKPDGKVYDMLIQACGKFGYTKKAFELFSDMKSRGLKPPNCTYTALFNACAYSPFKEDGLARAHQLYDLIVGSGRRLNTTQYDCAIKAFGRCGDFETALKLMDSMVREGHTITSSSFNALLHGCVEDKKNGFRDTLLLWRKMRLNGVRPSVQTYNLLLRAVRDCDAGESPNAGQELLESITGRESSLPKRFSKVPNERKALPSPPQLPSPPTSSVGAFSGEGGEELKPGKLDPTAELERHTRALMEALSLADANSPAAPLDVLGKSLVTQQSLNDIVGINRLEKCEDRLMLLGGASRVLLHMRADGLTPDIKTFSQLLSSLPKDDVSEMFLLDLLKIHGVKPDTDFFNQLIKRQCLRGYFTGAQNSLRIMSAEEGCQPNIMTFGVLALACSTEQRQSELLRNMEVLGFQLNVEIAGAFIRETLRAADYQRAIGLMKLIDDNGVLPSPGIIQLLERLRKRALVDRLAGEDHVFGATADASSETESQALEKKGRAIAFLGAYKLWIRRSKVDLPEHPWRHFEVGNPPKTEVVDAVER